MRMWMTNPKLLCNKHLLGEHGEIHKHKHNFEKNHKMDGRLFPVAQIEPMAMKVRHDELAAEMLNRGMNHLSPYTMPDIDYLGDKKYIKVDKSISLTDLSRRCEDCGGRINITL